MPSFDNSLQLDLACLVLGLTKREKKICFKKFQLSVERKTRVTSTTDNNLVHRHFLKKTLLCKVVRNSPQICYYVIRTYFLEIRKLLLLMSIISYLF